MRALSDSLVLTCHRDDFQTHLGRLTDIRRLWRFEALRKVPCLLALMMYPLACIALLACRSRVVSFWVKGANGVRIHADTTE